MLLPGGCGFVEFSSWHIFFGVVWLPSVFRLWKESAALERQKHQGQLGKHYSSVSSTCRFDMLIIDAFEVRDVVFLLWSCVLFLFCLMDLLPPLRFEQKVSPHSSQRGSCFSI